MPEVPVCKEMNDELTVFFAVFFGVPLLLIVAGIVFFLVRVLARRPAAPTEVRTASRRAAATGELPPARRTS
ncbi:hypothetical protein [Tsukamurella sp. NPDC003166]|uniref:hypothetical protein n=1 Tax=Tsukamurella sp. NPDC003166 TaxID=3154444 RepID=UPI0033A39D40